MTRLRDHDGMTLPEVLMALVIAMIVSLATFSLINTVMARSGEISARVDSTQRARAAMDFITRQLRSQVCVLSTSPATVDARAVVAATPTSVTFFGDLSDESHRTGNTLKAPELRSITLESGQLVERRWTGVKGGTANNPTYSYAGYPATPTQKRVLADDISTVDTTTVGGQPLVFRYYEYDAATPPEPKLEIDSRAGVTAAKAALITKIDIAFRANRSRGKSTDRGSTVLRNTIFVRSTDPNSTTPRPVCT